MKVHGIVYDGNIVLTPPLNKKMVVRKKNRAQETRLMVTLYIIDPYELRKEEKPHGENPPSKIEMKE